MSEIHGVDFWWIEEQHCSLCIGVGHHKPLTDDDNPSAIPWFRSLENGRLSEAEERYPLTFVDQWRNACNDSNVYRSLTLFNNSGQPTVLGPFLIDIDNSREEDGCKEDLDDALEVARATIKLLKGVPYEIPESDLRVFFSGRKGFNIEVCASSLGISVDTPFTDQVRCSAIKLDEIIAALRRDANVSGALANAVSQSGTIIYRIYGNKRCGYDIRHPYIRLSASMNEWILRDGRRMARRKTVLNPDELSGMSAEQICRKAQYEVSSGPSEH